jgi:hypothetical protein
MAYEVFKRTSVRVEEPSLSVTPDGRVVLNAAAARALAEAGVKSVLLLWDEINSKLAIKAAPKADRNAYAVSFTRNREGGSLRAKMFISHIGWSPLGRQRLDATWDPREKMLEAAVPRAFVTSNKVKDRKRGTKIDA